MDDIIIFSSSIEQHSRNLQIVLGKIKASGLSLNPGKCKIYKKELKILRNVVSNGTVKPDPEKVTAIKEYS